MTYKDRLLELHNIAVEKLRAYSTFEEEAQADEDVCGMCNPQTYQNKLAAYQSLQEAIERRNLFAKEINESQIDINTEYPMAQT